MSTPESEFLVRASELAFEVSRDGFRVSSLVIATRRIGLVDTGGSLPPPWYAEGEPPPQGAADRRGREWRRGHDWQPAAAAPAWMNLAWLLDDVAVWIGQLAEEHVAVLGLEAAEPDWCDLLVRDGDTLCRVRVRLADRQDPLDFPGMYLRDLFAEGCARDHLVPVPPGETAVVDLRPVL